MQSVFKFSAKNIPEKYLGRCNGFYPPFTIREKGNEFTEAGLQ